MRVRLSTARLAAAVLATAAGSLGLVATTSAPAQAAACPGPSGVTVVVDPGALGGAVSQTCNGGGGGRSAAAVFTGAGFSLTYVQRQPGFVCRIDGQPASDPCVNTPPGDAYWGLWWSDGRSGEWSYSSLAAGSLTVREGGYVAFVWQSGPKRPPGVRPAPHASVGSPTAAPSTKPPSTPTRPPTSAPASTPATTPSEIPPTAVASTGAPSSVGADASESAVTASADPTSAPASVLVPTSEPPAPAVTDGATGPESASPSPTDGLDADAGGDPDALPAWVVPVVLLVLGGGAGATYVLRRRHRSVR